VTHSLRPSHNPTPTAITDEAAAPGAPLHHLMLRSRVVTMLLLLATPLLAAAVDGAAPAPPGSVISASIDLTARPTPFPHYWKRCVGSGHLLLGTRSDWQGHLKLAHDELGFTGVRGHGLLDDDMSVLPGEWGSQAGTQWGLPSQQSPYEFYNVDVIYDFLMSIGVKPVVELSFMPKALVTCGGGTDPESGVTEPDCVYSHSTRGSGGPGHGAYKGLMMPPDDYNDWFLLVRALGRHLVERYGLEEVASWHFEVRSASVEICSQIVHLCSLIVPCTSL
jgi:xylan 1,4-beta-xylosidase